MENTASYIKQYKRFPAFGKQLMSLRRTGKIPARMVMVVFNWKLARTYPRLVIPNDIVPEELDFSYLAGLPVQIVYCDEDAHKVDAVVQAISKVNPCFLSTFGLDLVDSGESRVIINPFEEIQVQRVA